MECGLPKAFFKVESDIQFTHVGGLLITCTHKYTPTCTCAGMHTLVHPCMHACTHAQAFPLTLTAYLEAALSPAPTFWVFVGVGDVLPLITAHSLRANLQPHDQGVVDGLVHGPVCLPDPVHHISIDLSKDEWGIILGGQVTLFDGTNWHWATAVRPWLRKAVGRDGLGCRREVPSVSSTASQQ